MFSWLVIVWSIATGWTPASVRPATPAVVGIQISPLIPSRAIPAHSGTWTATFRVYNSTSTTKVVSLSCGGTMASCTPATTSISLGSHLDTEVNVTFTTSGVDAFGELSLLGTAAGTTSGTDPMAIAVGPSMVRMSGPGPDPNATQVVHRTRPVLRADFVLPTGEATDTNAVQLWWKGVLIPLGALRRNATMLEWEVPADRALAAGDSGAFKVRQCLVSTICTEETRYVKLPADQTPVLDFTGMPFEAAGGGFSGPLGPGIAVSGAEVETGFATPAYQSMGVARSAALVYSTRTSYPRALVATNIVLPWPAGTPDQVKAVLYDGGAVKDSVVLASPSCLTGAAKMCRVVLQAEYGTGTISGGFSRRRLLVQVSVTSGGVTKMTTDSVEVILVDRRDSPYGSGWWPAAATRVYGAGTDRVLVGPTGSATTYRSTNDTLYLPPPGTTTNLFRTASGWELRTRGTTAKVVFDANGRLIKGVDASGNRDSIAYDTAGRVTTLVDPRNYTITFHYAGGTHKLDSIVSLPGTSGKRTTRVLVDATTNQLRYDSLSSPVGRPLIARFGYDTFAGAASGTALLRSREGALASDSVTIAYDTAARLRRPTQATLVAATLQGTAPVIGYRAAELQGWHGLRSLDSIYVEVVDPLGHWTRSRVSRWGQSELTWDAIGVMGRTTYDELGRVVWSEGKNGDSTRVYSSYDALGRFTSRFAKRSASDTLWLTRLAYDDEDRVVQSRDPEGRSTFFTYDSLGRLLTTRDPNNAVTEMRYTSDGLLDSMRAPLDTGWTRITFDSVWRQPSRTYDQLGKLQSIAIYDSVGRVREGRGLRARSQTGSVVHLGWSSSYQHYGADNLPDSSRAGEWSGCTDSDTLCTAPNGSFTLAARAAHRYDAAGRDTLVIQWSGNQQVKSRVRYDRLSRVVTSWPYADSTGIRDSMVYDLAGNVTQRITRRGFTITSAYDSRGRDTLTTIPGVGNLRRTYGGPTDQLTRMWYDSYVDSVTGVDPTRAWVYDARGRLRADSLWTGSVARVMQYRYDQAERPDSVWTSQLGRKYRYESVRGLLDRMITSAGDTLTMNFDARGRLTADTLRAPTAAGGRWLGKTQGYRTTGELQSRILWLGGGPSGTNYVAGALTPGSLTNPEYTGPRLQMHYLQQTDASQPELVEDDAATYDANGRLRSWTGKVSGNVIWNTAYSFDQAGNLTPGGELRTFDSTTNQLLYQLADSVRSRYGYDRAGNLVTRLDSLVNPAPGGVTFRCSWQYDYDPLDRLVEVRAKSSAGASFTLVARYGYDVLGNRIAKRVYADPCGTGATSPGYTRYAVWGGQVEFETDAAGTIGNQYIWGPGVDNLLVAVDPTDSTRYFAVTDKLGSIRSWIAQDGTWNGRSRYSPWGATLIKNFGSTDRFPYRWAGRELDKETGFYYLRARYYDPRQGRFTQEDPIGLVGGRNLYAYVEGSPLEARDPTGLWRDQALNDPCPMECMRAGWDGWMGVTAWLFPMKYTDEYRDGAFVRRHEGWIVSTYKQISVIGDALFQQAFDDLWAGSEDFRHAVGYLGDNSQLSLGVTIEQVATSSLTACSGSCTGFFDGLGAPTTVLADVRRILIQINMPEVARVASRPTTILDGDRQGMALRLIMAHEVGHAYNGMNGYVPLGRTLVSPNYASEFAADAFMGLVFQQAGWRQCVPPANSPGTCR